MGFKDATSKERFVILTNAALRTAQFVVALVTIGIYAVIKANWKTDVPGKLSFEIAIGVIALVISLAFGAIPFVFSYRIVAFGAVLDLIMVALYGVAFGLMDGIYKDSYVEHPKSNWVWKGSEDHQQIARDLNTFRGDSYVNIAGLVLFLASGIMGVILICLGRRNTKGGFKV